MISRPCRPVFAVLSLCLLGLATATARAAVPREVLVLFDEDNDLPGLAAINRSLRDGLRGRCRKASCSTANPCSSRNSRMPTTTRCSRNTCSRKYADKKLDLIVAVMEPSLDFVLRHRDAIFPGVPIVFCGVDSTDLEGRSLPQDVTGVMMKRSFAPSLQAALELQPDHADRCSWSAAASQVRPEDPGDRAPRLSALRRARRARAG